MHTYSINRQIDKFDILESVYHISKQNDKVPKTCRCMITINSPKFFSQVTTNRKYETLEVNIRYFGASYKFFIRRLTTVSFFFPVYCLVYFSQIMIAEQTSITSGRFQVFSKTQPVSVETINPPEVTLSFGFVCL